MLGAKGFTLDKNLFRQREIMFNTFILLLEDHKFISVCALSRAILNK